MISPKKFTVALSHAYNGFIYLFNTQNNFRIHLIISTLVVMLGILLRINRFEWLTILLVIGLIWIVEAINTVFERLFDLLDETYNPIVKVGKDVAAATVLFSAILSVIVGLIIFIPPLLTLLRSIL